MKLYATVASERASKGQGGNDYVDIVLTYKYGNETRILTRMNMSIEDGAVVLFDNSHGEIARAELEKGNKQKGEIDPLQVAECEHIFIKGVCALCSWSED